MEFVCSGILNDELNNELNELHLIGSSYVGSQMFRDYRLCYFSLVERVNQYHQQSEIHHFLIMGCLHYLENWRSWQSCSKSELSNDALKYASLFECLFPSFTSDLLKN